MVRVAECGSSARTNEASAMVDRATPTSVRETSTHLTAAENHIRRGTGDQLRQKPSRTPRRSASVPPTGGKRFSACRRGRHGRRSPTGGALRSVDARAGLRGGYRARHALGLLALVHDFALVRGLEWSQSRLRDVVAQGVVDVALEVAEQQLGHTRSGDDAGAGLRLVLDVVRRPGGVAEGHRLALSMSHDSGCRRPQEALTAPRSRCRRERKAPASTRRRHDEGPSLRP